MTTATDKGKTVVTFFDAEDILRCFPLNKAMYYLRKMGQLKLNLGYDWDIMRITSDLETSGVCFDLVKHRSKKKLFSDYSSNNKEIRGNMEGFKKMILKNTIKYATSTPKIILKFKTAGESEMSQDLNEIAGNPACIALANVAYLYLSEKYEKTPSQHLKYRLVYTREEKLYISLFVDL